MQKKIIQKSKKRKVNFEINEDEEKDDMGNWKYAAKGLMINA